MRPPCHLPPRALLAALLAAALGCGGSGRAESPPPAAAPRADHTTVAASSIPLAALDAARALRMHLRHASVGANLWGGLTVLAASDPARHAFPAWTEVDRGNPGWRAKIDDFSSFVSAHAAEHDVFQMKLCYIDQHASFGAYRDALLALEAAHPTRTIVWWTMPLMTSGSENALRATFNRQVRDYCAANGKPLYDIAAIESHDAAGNPVTSGGVEAMAPAWSSDGGHLNAAGRARAAQAMWWLMARLAGWAGP